MISTPAPFPVWGLKTDLPLLPSDGRAFNKDRLVSSVTVHYGQLLAEGPGVLVTSYRPQLIVEQPSAPGHGFMFRGAFSIAREMAMMFTEALVRQEGLTPAQVVERFKPLAWRYPICDVIIQCGHLMVPALAFEVGSPGASVIVSADLLTHPVAVGLWRCQIEPWLKLFSGIPDIGRRHEAC